MVELIGRHCARVALSHRLLGGGKLKAGMSLKGRQHQYENGGSSHWAPKPVQLSRGALRPRRASSLGMEQSVVAGNPERLVLATADIQPPKLFVGC